MFGTVVLSNIGLNLGLFIHVYYTVNIGLMPWEYLGVSVEESPPTLVLIPLFCFYSLYNVRRRFGLKIHGKLPFE